MHHQDGAGGEELDGVVPVGDRVPGVFGGLPEAQQLGGELPVHGIGGGGQSAGAQGALVHPLQAVLQPGHVPAEHVGVGHHVVGEGGGLSPLEVGVTGHDGLQIGLGLLDQDLFQIQNLLDDHGDLFLYVQAEVHGHLIVPAAGGVEALAVLTDALGEDGLDVHVDVLVLHGELHFAALDVLQNGLQTVDDVVGVLLRDDALLAQHGGVGDGAPDVLLVQAGVKVDGGVKVVDQCVGLLLETSSPKFHIVSLLIGPV